MNDDNYISLLLNIYSYDHILDQNYLLYSENLIPILLIHPFLIKKFEEFSLIFINCFIIINYYYYFRTRHYSFQFWFSNILYLQSLTL